MVRLGILIGAVLPFLAIACKTEPPRGPEKPPPPRLERLVDNRARVSFNAPAANTPARDPTYRWSRSDLHQSWGRLSRQGYVILVSPRLPFRSMEEVDSVLIGIADHRDTPNLWLHWNDRPGISRNDTLQKVREIKTAGKPRKTAVLVPGEDLIDIAFLGNSRNEIAPRHFFLRYPRTPAGDVEFDSVTIVSKTESLDTERYGWTRQSLNGELRDSAFMVPPGSISYRTTLTGTSDLIFGLSHPNPAATLRYGITVERADQRRTLFEHTAAGSDGIADFRVPVPHDPSTGSAEQTITLHIEGDSTRNAALWYNPMIVRSRPQPASTPNVILYILDSLRPDYLGCYGHTGGTSPFIDELSARGVLFRRAYTAASWTKPSLVSLMTSLHPQTHRVGARTYSETLPEAVPTLADHLRDGGYITAQFSANPLSGALSNLDQGFDYSFLGNSFKIDRPDLKAGKIHSDDLNARILPWLEAHRGAPFFMMIHSVDTHPPFSPPERRALPRSSKRSSIRAYEESIRFNDSQIKRLYDKLTEIGIEKDTLLVITADHGEAFSDHGQGGHGRSVYEEEIHVPLLMVHGGRLSPAVISEPVHLMDVMPTILSHCSLPYERAGLQGVDLLKAGEARNGRKRILVSTRYVFPEGPEFFRGEEMYAVLDGSWKLVATTAPSGRAKRLELYNLAADPHERRNLATLERDRVEELHSFLVAFLADQAKRSAAFTLRTESDSSIRTLERGVLRDALERLRTLGYIR